MLLSRSPWLALSLLCCACELLVDFPEIRDDGGAPGDASADAAADELDADTTAPAMDASRDARPADVAPPDAEDMVRTDSSQTDASVETDAELVADANVTTDALVADANVETDAAATDAAAQTDAAVDASPMRCDTAKPVGSNGCVPTAPLCKLDANGLAACTGCLVNADCGNGAFCETATGACNTVCDPDGPLGDNGCTGATLYCGASATGHACRALAASDCTGATPAFVNGRCVECTGDASCTATAGRPYCDANNQCVSCAALPAPACIDRNRAAPFCSVSSGTCVRCLVSTDCSAQLTPSTTPICLNATCVACNAAGLPTPENSCSVGLGGPVCVLSGPEAGRCGAAP